MNKWIEDIDEVTNNFQEEFGQLKEDQLNWKPNPEAWSIAQNIDHLITINGTYFPVIESIRNGTYETPFIAKIGLLVSFFGKTVLKAVSPDRRKKIKTFPIWEPAKSEYSIEILRVFQEHQTKLKKIIESTTDLIEKDVIISSPANRFIVYKLKTAFEIIVTHETRHFEQSKEILHLMPQK